MITPTKGIAADRALLAVGAQLLPVLDEPRTVSRCYALLLRRRAALGHRTPVSFEWYTLALDLLYALGLVELRDELLVAVRVEDVRVEDVRAEEGRAEDVRAEDGRAEGVRARGVRDEAARPHAEGGGDAA